MPGRRARPQAGGTMERDAAHPAREMVSTSPTTDLPGLCARIGHDPDALEAVYREHVRDVERFVSRRVRAAGRWAVAATIAAIGLGAGVLVPTVLAEPAWAVDAGADGAVDVRVNRIEDADGLERALAAEGITADVTFVPDGGRCSPGRYAARETPGLATSTGSDHSFRGDDRRGRGSP